jgi:hypothetical protein
MVRRVPTDEQRLSVSNMLFLPLSFLFPLLDKLVGHCKKKKVWLFVYLIKLGHHSFDFNAFNLNSLLIVIFNFIS